MPSKADIRALKRIAESKDVGAALAAYLSRFKGLKARSPSAHAAKKKQKRLSRKGAVAAVRPLVVDRANGHCECGCGVPFGVGNTDYSADWDEFYGRKRVSVQETWMLSRRHHLLKTQNWPYRAYWDEKFKAHCAKYGYPFRPRLVKGAVVAQPPKERGVTNG